MWVYMQPDLAIAESIGEENTRKENGVAQEEKDEFAKLVFHFGDVYLSTLEDNSAIDLMLVKQYQPLLFAEIQ